MNRTTRAYIAPTPDAFINELLNHACPATSRVEGSTTIVTVWIETHCVGWWVEAWKDDHDEWRILRMTPEDC